MNGFERIHECVANWTDAGQWGLTNEPIVRCKDCVWGKAVEQVGCVRFEDRRSDGLKDQDGFCAWGETKDGDSDEHD